MSISEQIRRAAAGVSAGDFNPQTDITWHSLFWAEGTDFIAQGYGDGNNITTWPNETGESDGTAGGTAPTYDAVNPSYNSQPTVQFPAATDGRVDTANFTTPPAAPYSVVAIANFGTLSSQIALFDGNDTGNRALVLLGTSAPWAYGIFAGGTARYGGAGDTNPHLFVGYFDGSTGNERLDVDGSTIVSGSDAGSQTLDGLRIGNLISTSAHCFRGSMPMLGIYEGDFTSDGSYADFTTWAEDHYGLTIA